MEYIIERKTLADLSASIKDGRYKEQKERMLYSIKKNIRKIVLIEGTDYDNFNLPLNTLNSVIINTLIRDNIHIYMSKDKNDTIQFIENIILQLPKYYDDLKKEIIYGEEKIFNNEFNCKINKKDNLTENICFRNMLSQIPGVSISIASIYVEKYKNMENFILKLNEESGNDKNKIIKLLSEEKYGTNQRRIGDKLSEKIVQFIFNYKNDISNSKIKKKSNTKNISLFSD